MKKLLISLAYILTIVLPTLAKDPQVVSIDLKSSARPLTHFSDLERGLSLYVTSDVRNSSIIDFTQISKSEQKKIKDVRFNITPSVSEFVEESLSSYIRNQNISLGKDHRNDYTLKVTVTDFQYTEDAWLNTKAVVTLEYSLINKSNDILLNQVATGRASGKVSYVGGNQINGFVKVKEQREWMDIPDLLDAAFSKAVQNIDWNGIVSYLKGPEVKDKKVSGNGDTELEHLVIRWYIESRPAGADISWRIVSSTPDVKNTNSTYVGTTPYESTESFDIKGLDRSNAGNVQIEIKCEKPGYLPQTRRFNLLQAIDQKEISAKFNLVKEE